MEQQPGASPPPGSFGALLRACRHQAYLSQEQLAARAEVSERTVRNLEAGRVRSPRTDTVRLLADALHLSKRERESWFEVARGVHRPRAAPAFAAGGPAQPPRDPPAWPPLMDAVAAAPGSRRVLFENDDVRVLEVTITAEDREAEHTHPDPSVMGVDGPARNRYYQGHGLTFASPADAAAGGTQAGW